MHNRALAAFGCSLCPWIEPGLSPGTTYMTLCAKDTEAYMYRCIVRSKGLAGIEDKEDFEKLEKKRPIPTGPVMIGT